jgi:hypothetical protein
MDIPSCWLITEKLRQPACAFQSSARLCARVIWSRGTRRAMICMMADAFAMARENESDLFFVRLMIELVCADKLDDYRRRDPGWLQRQLYRSSNS